MLCVIAKLSRSATEELRLLQRVAASFGMHPSPVYGHVTIAAYTSDDDAEFIAGCKELLQGIGSFSVFFDKIEVLSETSIIVATPRKDSVLTALHDRLAARYVPFWINGLVAIAGIPTQRCCIIRRLIWLASAGLCGRYFLPLKPL